MALTENQKMELDNIIRNHLENDLIGKTHTNNSVYHLIKDELNFRLTLTSIVASFNRILADSPYIRENTTSYGSSENVYIIVAPTFVSNGKIKKNKNIITFENELEGKENITYDFNTKTFSADILKGSAIRGNHYHQELRNILSGDTTKKIFEYEWLFNYINDIETLYDFASKLYKADYSTCPQGFIKSLQERNLEFTYDNYEDYVRELKFGKYGLNLIDSGINESLVEYLIENDLIKNFSRCLIYNAKSGYLPSSYDIRRCLESLRKINASKEDRSEWVCLDENKSFDANRVMLETMIDEQKNVLLATQLQKLNFINGLTYKDKFIVVVPQTQEDKKKEGSMQHNCVGYYYDNTILEGINKIFFIRKLEIPEQSYITCRYNREWKEVAEYRGFANRPVTDTDALDFIKEIEKIIIDNLE